MNNITPALVREALATLPANLPRDEWARIGMAIKSEYPDDTGFGLFDAWSATAEGYDPKAVRSTWQSIKAGGGVAIGTLLHLAQQNGFVLPASDAQPPATEPQAQAAQALQAQALASDRAARAQAETSQREAERSKAAARAVALWNQSPDCTEHAYLSRKGVQPFGLRVASDGSLLVPLRDDVGTLWNVQRIAPSKPADGGSDKRFLSGGRKSGLWHWLGMPKGAAVLLLAEGYATAASLHHATGYPVAVCFDAGNIKTVAPCIRKLHTSARMLVCGDDDAATANSNGRNPGKEAATKAAQAVQGVAVLPTGLQGDETDFNDLAQRLGLQAVATQIAQALESANHAAQGKAQATDDSDPFQVRDDGVWFCGRDGDGKPKPPMLLCSRLDVTAITRGFDNEGFGYLLEFPDRLANPKRWPMPARMLSGDGNEYRATLLGMGLRIESGAAVRALLTRYIQSREPGVSAHCTDKTGWHQGHVFVLPKQTIGDTRSGVDRVLFQSDTAMENTYSTRGELSQWRDNVAALCVGNSRLAFAVSAAFAGVLLRFAEAESGGFHYRGDSSSGKTTALRVAASVWGSPKFMQRWRTTDNALEATAAQHNDTLLILDELAQLDPKNAGECAYMLANGQSKARAARTGTAKPRLNWRLLFLSAGEVGLAAHMQEGGKRTRAGQELRMADIPADAGAGMGAFEALHDSEGGAAFSTRLAQAVERHYGSAGVAFVQWVADKHEGMAKRVKHDLERITAQLVPTGAAGQVQRVGGRFALVAVGGELATEAGLTGWPPGESTRAVKACFDAWLSTRGGIGNAEEYGMLAQVRSFLELHGNARFMWWHRAADDHAPNVQNRAGFKRMCTPEGKAIKKNSDHQREYGEKMQPEDGEGTQTEYFILPEVFDREICQGYDPQAVKRLLRDRGHLEPDGQHLHRKERLPTMGNLRCIKIKPSIFESSE